MTVGRWFAVALLLALAAGGWWAVESGHAARARAGYAEWAEARRVEAGGREGRGEKPTLLTLGLDGVARWVPGR